MTIQLWITVEQDGKIRNPPRLYGFAESNEDASLLLSKLKKQGYRGAYFLSTTGVQHYIGSSVYLPPLEKTKP